MFGWRRQVKRYSATAVAGVAVVVMLFPVFSIVVASFESTTTLFSGTYYFLPHQPTLANYRLVLSGQGANVATSLIVALGTVALTLAVSVPAAYALSKYRLRVTAIVVSGLLVAQIVPSIVLATSLFIVFHWIHLLNSYVGLILADGTYTVPFGILVLRAFFFGLPTDLMQAARIDGASEWRVFRSVMLPLARSAIITVGLFAFLNGWGDFIFALTMLNGTGIVPVTLGLFDYLGNFSSNWGAVMATTAIAMVPAGLMLVVAQRYIAAGLTAGSVKG